MAERKKMVMAVFRDRASAEQAFDYLHGMGYRDSEINVLMSDRTRATYYATTENKDRSKHEAGTLATEGMGVGGAIGTAIGAAVAAALTIGSTVAIPGLGIIAGPLAAA